MTRRFTIAVILVAVAISAVAYLWMSSREQHEQPHSDATSSRADQRRAHQARESGVAVPQSRQSAALALASAQARNLGSDWNSPPKNPVTNAVIHHGLRTLDRLSERYFARVSAARKGDQDAMVEVARVLFNCWWPLGFRDVAAARTSFDAGDLSAEWFAETQRQLHTCDPIAADVKRDFPRLARTEVATLGREAWLQRAAARGSKVARLELLSDLPGESQELAALLDELVDQRDPFVLMRAGEFMSVRRGAGDEREDGKWAHLACLSHPTCDPANYRSSFLSRYPAGVQVEITEFAETFTTLDDIGFSFREVERTRPYTSYTPEELEMNEKLRKRTRDSNAIGAAELRDAVTDR